MAERRMLETYATALHDKTAEVSNLLNSWQDAHPNVADYRVTEALSKLRRVETLLGYLRDNVDPEGDAARAELRRKGFFGEDKPTTQDLVAAASKVLTAAGYTEVVEPIAEADAPRTGFLVEAMNDGKTVFVYHVIDGERMTGAGEVLDYAAALETAGYTGEDDSPIPGVQHSTPTHTTRVIAFPPAQG
ncbi:hypothetical protein [Streptomyces sp. NPDC059761]|uniref:hypothetical protein n=1 Tax=Streptomyces sp. NPDC059761 TaxID=3346937 RepID=UPI00365305E3